jgi:hypothetical protein
LPGNGTSPSTGGVSSSEGLESGVFSVAPALAPLGSLAFGPALQTIVNGDFSNADPASSNFGWQAGSHVVFTGGHASLDEAEGHSTQLAQEFTLPSGVTALSFTLDSLNLHNNDALNLPPDAFEVALLDANTGLPLLTADGLALAESLLNFQYDGRVFYSRQTLIDGAVATGELLNPSLRSPTTITIDLRDIPASTPVRLVFTLIGFGADDSSVAIDNVALLGDAPLPPRLTLALDPASDTGVSGDLLTNRAAVRLIGKTEPLQQVFLDIDGDGFDDGSTIADADGNYAFDNVPLAEGIDALRTRAANSAGATLATLLVTRDSVAPPLSLNLAPESDTPPADDATTMGVVNLVGVTDPLQAVTLDQTGATVTADATGHFTFSNLPLTSGANAFTLHATDAAGNTSTLTRTFTRLTPDAVPPVLSAVLGNDTGRSNIDHYTSDATVIGSAVDDTALASLMLSVDGSAGVSILDLVQSDGSFNISAARLAQILGVAVLPDGNHTLLFTVTDQQNNSTSATLAFYLDTTAPSLTFDLDLSSDTLPVGDLRTSVASVGMTGLTEGFASWSLAGTNFSGDSDSFGFFNFGALSLNTGANSFTVTAIDLAGNSTTLTRTFTRFVNETVPPVITASLLHDNGVSNVDHISNDPTVTGSVVDDSPIATFTAGFDSAAPASFTNLLADLSSTGAFTLSPSRLEDIYGGVIPDGPHTLHFVATDAFGNSSTFDLAFNLDTAAPRFLYPGIVNSGNAQRSRIDQIELPFSRDVFPSADLGDFRLVNHNGQTVSLAGATLRRGGSANSIVLDLHNVTLADGDYDLEIIPDSLSDSAGNSLDVDGDGIGDAGSGKFAITSFHKLAGDANGDRSVNALDLLVVRKTLGKASGQSGFDPNGDLTGDGTVDANDLNIASVNQGHTVSVLAAPKLVVLENSGTANDRAADFGTVTTTLSGPIDITLRNDGQLPLTISSIQIVGTDAGSFQWEVIGGFVPTSGMTINPGESRIVRVQMTAFTSGNKSAELRFWHNDPSQASPASVTLAGIAAAPAPGVSATGAVVPVSSGDSSSGTVLGGISTGVTIVPPAPATPAKPLPITVKPPKAPAATTPPLKVQKPLKKAPAIFNTKNTAKPPAVTKLAASPVPVAPSASLPFSTNSHRDLKALLS